MSLPGPLTWEPKRFGSEREAPARAPRPYLERLKTAEELTKKATLPQSSLRASLPTVAQLTMVLGALAPVAYAFPGVRDVFFGPLVVALYPLTQPLAIMSDWLAAGWFGALLVLLAGASGLIAAWIASAAGERETSAGRLLSALAVVLFSLITAGLLLAMPSGSSLSASAGAAWVIMTGAAGVYGARLIAQRESWLGAVCGAFALICGGRIILGSAALVALIYCDKAFPGQTVAKYPWSRSQVALEPLIAPAANEAAPEGLHDPWGGPKPQSLFVATVALVFGAFAPIVLALPAFGITLFGPLVFLFWPLTAFAAYTAGTIDTSVLTLVNGGPDLLIAVLTLLWFVGIATAGALVAARAVASRKRKWAAVAGGLMLIVGGRPLFGIVALVAVAYAWPLFDQEPHEAEAEAPKEPAPGASAH